MQGLERKVWEKYRKGYNLPRLAKEISALTGWSIYISLVYVVDYLHHEKGIGFSRKQLRYAFSKVPEDEIPPESRTGAWIHLLRAGGYRYERGGLREKSKPSILSSLPLKIPSEGV